MNPVITDLSSGWNKCLIFGSVVWPFGEEPRHAFSIRIGGAWRRSSCFGEEKNLLSVPGIEPRSSSPWPRHCVDPRNQITDIKLVASVRKIRK
jgi:hypothetical protein